MSHSDENKKSLGQFYTTNYKYILENMCIPKDVKNIIEPFAGNGDLLNFITDKDKYKIECYDIDPKKDFIIKRDTLNNPPIYSKKFTITNPPYLARNKSTSKAIFDKYDVNDLYKCYLKCLIKDKCSGGIIIIPLNFWSSIRENDINLRKDFLGVYDIMQLNIFEENVFEDTSYTVCSFQFQLKVDHTHEQPISITIYPKKNKLNIILNEDNNYTIGGEIYNLKINKTYKISRATKENEKSLNTNIHVKCIDDNSKSQIRLSIVSDKERFIDKTPNLSARSFATLIITPAINLERQQKLVIDFNNLLTEYRNKYNSLFLTNYRESHDIARKRISFDLVYQIVSYLL
jgi:hypothetical protein